MAAGDTTAYSTPIWERASLCGPFDLDMTARLLLKSIWPLVTRVLGLPPIGRLSIRDTLG